MPRSPDGIVYAVRREKASLPPVEFTHSQYQSGMTISFRYRGNRQWKDMTGEERVRCLQAIARYLRGVGDQLDETVANIVNEIVDGEDAYA